MATWLLPCQIIPNRAAGYTSTKGGDIRNADLLDTSCRIPAGGFVSTAGDVARFAMGIQGSRLLQAATAREMMRSQLTTGIVERTVKGMELPDGYVFPGFGLGWAIDMSAPVAVHHGGNQPGATSMLYQVPGRGIAVVILTNLDSKGQEISSLAKAIASAVP